MDWFFRGFNQLGLYENFLKSTPRYYTFIVFGGMALGYGWNRGWDHYWCHLNK